MINELIFIAHASLLTLFLIISLRIGKEALITLICLYGVLANLFITKQITLMGLESTACDAFAVASILGLNLVQEYYGSTSAQKTICISFLSLVAYTLSSQMHLWYEPSISDSAHGHFCALLEVMPRITVASIFVFLLVQYIDRKLYAWLQQQCKDRHFMLRNYTSLALCQLIDTILFSFLGLYGIVENIWHIIAISYLIKVVTIAVSTPWIALCAVKIKKFKPIE